MRLVPDAGYDGGAPPFDTPVATDVQFSGAVCARYCFTCMTGNSMCSDDQVTKRFTMPGYIMVSSDAIPLLTSKMVRQ